MPVKQRMAYETMATMENKISQLKTDLENAVRRGDELYGKLQQQTESNNVRVESLLATIENMNEEIHRQDEIIEEKDGQVDFLCKEADKQDEIIKELEESNEFYAKESNWQNVTAKVRKTGGKLVREKKKKVEALRNNES